MSQEEKADLATVPEDSEIIEDKNISEDDDSEETLLEEEIQEIEKIEEVKIKPKRKYTKRQPKETIKTSDENVTVLLKSRKKGPKKKQVIVYREDLPVEPIEIVEKVKRPAGRPKKKELVKIVKELDEPDCIVFEKPSKVKMTARELKKMELEIRLLELQGVSGNSNLKLNKKGKVDGRMVKVRTQKQIEATARLVEANKLRRMKKKDDEKQEILGEQQEVVKNILGTLAQNKVAKIEQDNQKAQADAAKQAKAEAKKKKMAAMFD
jgi:hypothetical protein